MQSTRQTADLAGRSYPLESTPGLRHKEGLLYLACVRGSPSLAWWVYTLDRHGATSVQLTAADLKLAARALELIRGAVPAADDAPALHVALLLGECGFFVLEELATLARFFRPVRPLDGVSQHEE